MLKYLLDIINGYTNDLRYHFLTITISFRLQIAAVNKMLTGFEILPPVQNKAFEKKNFSTAPKVKKMSFTFAAVKMFC